MNLSKTFTIIGTLLFAAPTFAAETDNTFGNFFDGPNWALALIALIQLIAIMSIGGILKRLTRNTDYFVKLKKLRENTGAKVVILILFFLSQVGEVVAQEARVPAPTYPEFARDPNTMLLLGLNVLLLLVFIYMTRLLKNTVGMLMPELQKAPQTEVEAKKAEEPSKVIQALTDAVPVEREHEIMTDHEYDGIHELDNNLPPWWVWMFNITIVFSVVYMVYYHVLPYGKSQEEQYIAEVQEAEIARQEYLALAKDLVDENTVEFLGDASDLQAGKSIFTTNCQQCHAPDGGGGVGPNLTDDFWIHGGSVKDIFKTVKYGVPSKGMISWEAQLKPLQMAQVSSYIKTLQGTTPAAPKEPQGELWVAPEETESLPAEGDSGTQEPDSLKSEKQAEQTAVLP